MSLRLPRRPAVGFPWALGFLRRVPAGDLTAPGFRDPPRSALHAVDRVGGEGHRPLDRDRRLADLPGLTRDPSGRPRPHRVQGPVADRPSDQPHATVVCGEVEQKRSSVLDCHGLHGCKSRPGMRGAWHVELAHLGAARQQRVELAEAAPTAVRAYCTVPGVRRIPSSSRTGPHPAPSRSARGGPPGAPGARRQAQQVLGVRQAVCPRAAHRGAGSRGPLGQPHVDSPRKVAKRSIVQQAKPPYRRREDGPQPPA